nr:hypothetical protein [Synergistaceae bacterium]
TQQNSNITYRVYDYNRLGQDGKPRELHINKALDVMNLNFKDNYDIPSDAPFNSKILKLKSGESFKLVNRKNFISIILLSGEANLNNLKLTQYQAILINKLDKDENLILSAGDKSAEILVSDF